LIAVCKEEILLSTEKGTEWFKRGTANVASACGTDSRDSSTAFDAAGNEFYWFCDSLEYI
jgi:hypothetical protein